MIRAPGHERMRTGETAVLQRVDLFHAFESVFCLERREGSDLIDFVRLRSGWRAELLGQLVPPPEDTCWAAWFETVVNPGLDTPFVRGPDDPLVRQRCVPMKRLQDTRVTLEATLPVVFSELVEGGGARGGCLLMGGGRQGAKARVQASTLVGTDSLELVRFAGELLDAHGANGLLWLEPGMRRIDEAPWSILAYAARPVFRVESDLPTPSGIERAAARRRLTALGLERWNLRRPAP